MPSGQQISIAANVARSSGSFTFRIGGFPALDEAVGECTESPEFELCSRRWQLRIFPGGSLPAHQGKCSYYLASKSNVQTRASYKLVVVCQNGGKDEVFQSSGIRRFEAMGDGGNSDGWGKDNFMDRSYLLNPRNGFCLDDTVIFRASVTVYGSFNGASGFASLHVFGTGSTTLMEDLSTVCREVIQENDYAVEETRGRKKHIKSSSTTSTRVYPQASSDEKNDGEGHCSMEDTPYLHSPMSPSYDLPGFHDVSIHVENQIFHAHRFVLCVRSPVFRAMLTSSMLEDELGLIHISDFKAKVIKALLKFMYTDQVDEMLLQTHCTDLLGVATKYQVLALAERCEEVLCAATSTDTVIEILIIADLFDTPALKAHCLSFIVKHASEVLSKGKMGDLPQLLRQEVLAGIQEALSNRDDCDDGLKKPSSCCIQ